MSEQLTSEAEQTRHQQMIAVIALVVLVVAGGAFALWKYHGSADEPQIDVSRGPAFGGNFRPRGNFSITPAAPVRRDGVRKTGLAASHNYEIRAGDAIIRVTQDKQGEWQFAGRYQPAKFSSPDQPKYLGVKYESLTLGLSEDQRKRLDALPAFAPSMVLTADDHAKIKDLWTAYMSADDAGKPQKETDLVKALADIGRQSEKPSMQATDAHIAQIKAILTPAQVEKLTAK